MRWFGNLIRMPDPLTGEVFWVPPKEQSSCSRDSGQTESLLDELGEEGALGVSAESAAHRTWTQTSQEKKYFIKCPTLPVALIFRLVKQVVVNWLYGVACPCGVSTYLKSLFQSVKYFSFLSFSVLKMGYT